jgi:hypothetical protein
VLPVNSDCVLKAEFIIKVKQLFAGDTLGLKPAAFVNFKRVLVKIVVGSYNKNPLSLFSNPQHSINSDGFPSLR